MEIRYTNLYISRKGPSCEARVVRGLGGSWADGPSARTFVSRETP